MKAVIAAALLAASPALAIDVPSGQAVTLQEVLVDTVGAETWIRFRFVVPAISTEKAGAEYETHVADMDHLCTELALPYISDYALTGDVIVISMADKQSEFGVADPDVTQYFEAYRPVDNICIWEGL